MDNIIEINMVGGGFQHDICSSAGRIPDHVEWVKGNHSAPISIHIDNAILNVPVNKSKLNYAWLTESRTITPHTYKWCEQNVEYLEDNFELIFTHDTSLLPLSKKFVLIICSAKHWVTDIGLHPKSKLLSMIASTKVMCAEHRYRQEIVVKYRNNLDLFGRGYNEIPTKDFGLKDYYFSIAMENHTYPIAYSEKITDCFATGTIPIYYGTPRINEVFNSDGIIMLDEFNIDELSPELYFSKMDAIKDNYNIAIDMPVAEDYIYLNFIK